MSKLCCPHCGSSTFIGTVTKGCIISYNDENETPSVKELADLGEELKIYKCGSCKAELKEEELTRGIQCKECGDFVSEEDINEEGLCPACAMIKSTNKSPAELLRELLKCKAEGSAVAKKMDKKQEQAKATVTETVKENTAEQKEEIPVEEVVIGPSEDKVDETEQPKKRGRKAGKKATTKTEETPVEETKEETPDNFINEPIAQEQISEAQDAPFPEVTEEVKALGENTEESTESHEDFPTFNMFDNVQETVEQPDDLNQAF